MIQDCQCGPWCAQYCLGVEQYQSQTQCHTCLWNSNKKTFHFAKSTSYELQKTHKSSWAQPPSQTEKHPQLSYRLSKKTFSSLQLTCECHNCCFHIQFFFFCTIVNQSYMTLQNFQNVLFHHLCKLTREDMKSFLLSLYGLKRDSVESGHVISQEWKTKNVAIKIKSRKVHSNESLMLRITSCTALL